jgi:ribonuclease P protein component
LTVSWVPGPGRPAVAYGISTKVGSAVRRNRVRRRLRHAAGAADLADGAWLIVAAPGAAEAPFASLERWLAEAVEGLVA